MASRRRLMPEVSLGRDSRLMTWSSNLNIYRVNRFHPLDLGSYGEGSKTNAQAVIKFDLIEALLMRNMIDEVEDIFSYVGLESVRECLLVSKLWHDFLSMHFFRRCADNLVQNDDSIRELAESENWIPYLEADHEDVENPLIFRKICYRIFDLCEVWRYREPKLRRLQCESFVLCLKFLDDELFCGLNSGCLQLWDLDWSAKKREQEIHDKGVKSLDLNDKIICTGSYDCTAKLWCRSAWTLLHVISIHADSVWDLKIRDDVLVTAGLDGTVGMFNINDDGTVEMIFLMQANEELVSAVDFNDSVMVTGYEDSKIGIWHLAAPRPPHHPPPLAHSLLGHNGGVTGLQINGSALASASYDGTVRIWSLSTGDCLHIFTDPGHFVRCISFKGDKLTSGDFGGNIHVWDLRVLDDCGRVSIKTHRQFHAHKGHVVCIQINARRIVSGSRDKTTLIQDFWAKMLDTEQQRTARAKESLVVSRPARRTSILGLSSSRYYRR